MDRTEVPLRERILKLFVIALTAIAGLALLYAIVALILIATGVWGGA